MVTSYFNRRTQSRGVTTLTTRRLEAPKIGVRGRRVFFYFDGEGVEGYEDEPLAAALHANGTTFLSRSIRYYRPRGVFDLQPSCRSALVDVNGIPDVNPSEVPCRDSLKVTGATQGVPLVVRLFSPMLNTSFQHNPLVRNKLLWPAVRSLVKNNANNPELPSEHKNESLGCADPATTLDTDIVVIGAGIAGLEAAYEAARNGLEVMVIDDQPKAGGKLRYDTSIPLGFKDEGQVIVKNLIEKVESCGVKLLLRTGVIGFYEDGLIAYKSDEPLGGRFYRLNAKEFVLAPGRVEIPSVFVNNDLPGIISSSMSLRLLNEYGTLPGQRCIIIGATDEGYRVASQLKRHGINLTIADRKIRSRQEYVDLAKDVDTVLDVKSVRARGRHSVEGVSLATDGEVKELAADFVVSSSLQSADIRLPAQAGITIAYFDGLGHAPVHNALMQTNVANVFVAGGVTGAPFEALHLLEGRIAGLTAALTLGSKDAESQRDEAVKEYRGKLQELSIVQSKNEMFSTFEGKARKETKVTDSPSWFSDSSDGMQFVCFCEDVLVKDIARVIRNIAFKKLEMIKRCTGICMGHCQGRLCLVNAALTASILADSDPNMVGLTRQRPPTQPVPLRVLSTM